MNIQKLKQQIMAQLEVDADNPVTAAALGDKLQLRSQERKKLQKALGELLREGRLVQMRGHSYGIGSSADLVTGTLGIARSGKGFVSPREGGTDVMVFQENQLTALPGDIVLVRLEHTPVEGGNKRRGKIIRVVERGRRDIVGTLRSTGRFLYVVPIDPGYQKDIYVSDKAGAQIGDRVVVRLQEWLHKHVNPEGDIVDVIGPAVSPDMDTTAVIRHFGFDEEFTDQVRQEAESVSALLESDAARQNREDFRKLRVVTIDPERARDFDDALSLEADEQGNRVLGVHIADVSYFVRPGTALDNEARKRGTSIYFPDRVLPMLPEQLSNGVCSLRPNQERLVFSVFMTFDKSGKCIKQRFYRGVIKSAARLVYTEAMEMIASGGSQPAKTEKNIRELVTGLSKLAQQLRRRRFRQTALDMDLPECEIVVDKTGHMTGLRRVENDESHQLVEECMVAANEAVARHLADQQWPAVVRLHEPPSPEKIEELTVSLLGMGFTPGDLSKRRNLGDFLKKIADHPLADTIRVMVLRSMSRAVYSAQKTGHYGLAKKYYAHFTSPIRRYPDLIVHRELGSLLEQEGCPYGKEELIAMAVSCTDSEWKADDAERMVLEVKKYRYLEAEIEKSSPQVFNAVVAKVTNFGLFVDLTDLQLQALVHISSISDQFVRFNRSKGTLKAGKKTYSVGQRLRVQPVQVDFDARKVAAVIA